MFEFMFVYSGFIMYVSKMLGKGGLSRSLTIGRVPHRTSAKLHRRTICSARKVTSIKRNNNRIDFRQSLKKVPGHPEIVTGGGRVAGANLRREKKAKVR
ncbi:hypothetical protein TYRP_021030 [Tyrophagus putrescentiae]|nr:hypothetical protein TYRP_021030 [Tyrophagus putrescentiae]